MNSFVISFLIFFQTVEIGFFQRMHKSLLKKSTYEVNLLKN